MNDREADKLIQKLAMDPAMNEFALELLSPDERAKALAFEAAHPVLDDARAAAIAARALRQLAPRPALLAFLRAQGLKLLQALGELREHAMQAPAAEQWLRLGLRPATPRLAHLGAEEEMETVPLVVDDEDGEHRYDGRCAAHWLGSGALRLELLVPNAVDHRHRGLREAQGIVILAGRGDDRRGSDLGFPVFTGSTDTHARYFFKAPFPEHKRGDGLAGKGVRVVDLIREVRLFPPAL